ncbi:Pumilio-family RNA binding repeat protein [Nitzschia inconspicua]|uniref:Pumilio-family RNA binding repeat protein n=1 Tax=Nitzschia inconspicua TaxID=303405 RepID=A0A9K3LZS5_9STRA|nr:Pumilio-family RNA binding repeat protein [Nitzschia inconspicua]
MTSSFAGYHRPRRPAVETISYLRGLPLNVDQSQQEIQTYRSMQKGNDAYDDFPQNLAAAFSALEEVQGEIASLAGDEYGSKSVELLAQIAAPYSEIAARCLLNACLGYCLHLATHRFGSHVLQSILQLSVISLSTNDMAMDENAPPSLREHANGVLPSLCDVIQAVVEELSPHSEELAVHMCGSHVLRTLLCVLGGVQLVTSHRGSDNQQGESSALLRGKPKSKKKKKRKRQSEDASSNGDATHNAGTMSITFLEGSRIDNVRFPVILESLSQALLGEHQSEPGKLQQLACHASAGPLLIVLIRVLTYSDETVQKDWKLNEDQIDAREAFQLGIVKVEPRYKFGSLADRAVRQILCWQSGETVQEFAGDIIYGLSGEIRGSHVLETVFRLCYDDFYSELLRCGDFLSSASVQEYVQHDVSNFVVQTILATVREKEQAETILKVIEKSISSGVAIDPNRKRRGIIWRAAELAAKYRVEQESVIKAIRLGFLAISNSSPVAENDDDEATARKKRKKERKKASMIELKECVPLLLQINENSIKSEQLSMDVAGTRTVYHMLRFSPRLCEGVLDGIVQELSTEELVSIAKDGLGSRCVLDGILDGPVQIPVFQKAVQELRSKFVGRIVSMANHRVAHHVVRKLFVALSTMGEKEKLADELIRGKNLLLGNAVGRSIIEDVRLDLYEMDKKEWRRKVA